MLGPTLGVYCACLLLTLSILSEVVAVTRYHPPRPQVTSPGTWHSSISYLHPVISLPQAALPSFYQPVPYLSHSALSPVQPVNSMLHSALSLMQPVNSVLHSSLPPVQPVNSLFHSALSLVQTINSQRHSALSSLQPINSQRHSALSSLQPVNSQRHSALSPVQPVNSVLHSALSPAQHPSAERYVALSFVQPTQHAVAPSKLSLSPSQPVQSASQPVSSTLRSIMSLAGPLLPSNNNSSLEKFSRNCSERFLIQPQSNMLSSDQVASNKQAQSASAQKDKMAKRVRLKQI
jgi:hypothetical protein